MTQKERLVELLKSVPPIIGSPCNADGTHYASIVSNSHIADYLLKNGVIVPPCKVGDSVYWLCDDEIIESTIEDVQFVDKIRDQRFYPHGYISFDSFGETVWLTRAEAEQVVKNRLKGIPSKAEIRVKKALKEQYNCEKTS